MNRKKHLRKTKAQLFADLARANARIGRIKKEIVLAVSDRPENMPNLLSRQKCHLNCALKE
jgi:hypothetical protein